VKTLFAFAILIVAGFVGSVKLFSKIKVSTPVAYLFFSGTFYIFFGLIIGENGLHLISKDISQHLIPVIQFSLGWIGFIFGFQIERKFLKRISFRWYSLLLLIYFTTFFLILMTTYVLFKTFLTDTVSDNTIILGMGIVFGILISESSISFIIWSSKFFKSSVKEIRFCTFIAALDNLFPIILIGLIFSVYRVEQNQAIITTYPINKIAMAFLLQISAGILTGLLIHLLVKKKKEKFEISAILFGTIFLISGISTMMHYSPLFVAAICGAVFSNTTRRHSEFLHLLNPTEKPVYIIFLIYLALFKSTLTFLTALIACILLITKFLAKMTTFKMLNVIKINWFQTPHTFSYLLLPTSSIAPAIMLDLIFSYPRMYTTLVAGVFIITMVISEIFAPIGIKLIQKNIRQ
jgi:hypothetical protein